MKTRTAASFETSSLGNNNAGAASSARLSGMSLFLGGSSHSKHLNLSHTPVFHLPLSGSHFGQLPITSPGVIKAITGPIRALWPAYLTPTSRGSLLLRSFDSYSCFTCKHQIEGFGETICNPSLVTRDPFHAHLADNAKHVTRKCEDPNTNRIVMRQGEARSTFELRSNCSHLTLQLAKTYLSRINCWLITNQPRYKNRFHK